MAPSLGEARRMVEVCRQARVPYFVHENWRWLNTVRLVSGAYDSAKSGRVVRF
jgi:predicted dehydrogenase